MIRGLNSSIESVHLSHAGIGKEFSVTSIYTLKNDCTELASCHIVLTHFTCDIPKEVLFGVLDKICNVAETNHVVRLMLENFVKKLVKGIYVDQSNGKHSGHNSEQGDFV